MMANGCSWLENEASAAMLHNRPRIFITQWFPCWFLCRKYINQYQLIRNTDKCVVACSRFRFAFSICDSGDPSLPNVYTYCICCGSICLGIDPFAISGEIFFFSTMYKFETRGTMIGIVPPKGLRKKNGHTNLRVSIRIDAIKSTVV